MSRALLENTTLLVLILSLVLLILLKLFVKVTSVIIKGITYVVALVVTIIVRSIINDKETFNPVGDNSTRSIISQFCSVLKDWTHI